MKVVVSAVAFSKNKELVDHLSSCFPESEVNSAGLRFTFEELIDYFKDADAIIIGLEKIDD